MTETSNGASAVYLSAVAARAYVVTSDSILTFRAFNPGVDVATSAQLNNFFQLYSDIVVHHEAYPFARARAELAALTRRARALNFVLEVLDVTVTEAVRNDAARAADRLLQDAALRADLLEVLMSIPPPADADYDSAVELAKKKNLANLQAVCEGVNTHIPMIRRMYVSWCAMLQRLPNTAIRNEVAEYAKSARMLGLAVCRGLQEARKRAEQDLEARTLVYQIIREWLDCQTAGPNVSARHGILCDDVRRVVYFFLDGELAQARSDSLLAHLSVCVDCEVRLVLHRRLRTFVRKRLSRISAPPALKARIAGSLRQSPAH